MGLVGTAQFWWDIRVWTLSSQLDDTKNETKETPKKED